MKKILYIISVVALLVGCSKHDGDTPDNTWNGEIRLSSGITAQTRATQDYQSAQLNAGNLVGVFINEDGGNATTYTQNVQYTANGSGSFADAPTVYFPASGNPVNIYAYAPGNEAWSDLAQSYPFTVKPNQHSEADYIASDLLWGEPMSTDATPAKLNPVARTKEAINLHFRHLLSKVRVTIVNGAGVTSEDVTKIELLDLLPSTEMKMADGTISVAKGDKANVILFGANDQIITSSSAVVVPQTVATNSKFLRFGLKQGGELFYTLSKELTMESGKIYDFTITMNLTGVTVKSTVSDWATGEELTGGAEMPVPIGSKTDPATAAIGDFYFSDGTLEASTATLTQAQKTQCIGIVFYKSADGNTGKIVGLDEVQKAWSTENTDTGATSDTDGAGNMSTILALPTYSATTYPAFAWCAEQGAGWYIPAKDELSALYNAYAADKTAFNNKLTICGGVAFIANYYWSATQNSSNNSWIVYFSNGYTNHYSKSSSNYRVRCVRAF